MSIIKGRRKIFHFFERFRAFTSHAGSQVVCESAARFTRGGVPGIKVSISIVIG